MDGRSRVRVPIVLVSTGTLPKGFMCIALFRACAGCKTLKPSRGFRPWTSDRGVDRTLCAACVSAKRRVREDKCNAAKSTANRGRLPRGHRPVRCSRDEAAQTICRLGPKCTDEACKLDHGDSMVMMTMWQALLLADAAPATCPACSATLVHTRSWYGYAGNAAILPTCPACPHAGEWQQLQEEVEVSESPAVGCAAASVVLTSGATTPSSTERTWAAERPEKLARAQRVSKPILQALSACDVAGAKWGKFTEVCAGWGWKFPAKARAQHAHMGAAWDLADVYTGLGVEDLKQRVAKGATKAVGACDGCYHQIRNSTHGFTVVCDATVPIISPIAGTATSRFVNDSARALGCPSYGGTAQTMEVDALELNLQALEGQGLFLEVMAKDGDCQTGPTLEKHGVSAVLDSNHAHKNSQKPVMEAANDKSVQDLHAAPVENGGCKDATDCFKNCGQLKENTARHVLRKAIRWHWEESLKIYKGGGSLEEYVVDFRRRLHVALQHLFNNHAGCDQAHCAYKITPFTEHAEAATSDADTSTEANPEDPAARTTKSKHKYRFVTCRPQQIAIEEAVLDYYHEDLIRRLGEYHSNQCEGFNSVLNQSELCRKRIPTTPHCYLTGTALVVAKMGESAAVWRHFRDALPGVPYAGIPRQVRHLEILGRHLGTQPVLFSRRAQQVFTRDLKVTSAHRARQRLESTRRARNEKRTEKRQRASEREGGAVDPLVCRSTGKCLGHNGETDEHRTSKKKRGKAKGGGGGAHQKHGRAKLKRGNMVAQIETWKKENPHLTVFTGMKFMKAYRPHADIFAQYSLVEKALKAELGGEADDEEDDEEDDGEDGGGRTEDDAEACGGCGQCVACWAEVDDQLVAGV